MNLSSTSLDTVGFPIAYWWRECWCCAGSAEPPRAGIVDGMRVLDLGCGWGSLSLWIARRFPNCTVVSVSNSNAQRLDIERRCRQEEITNVEVITADVNDFDHGDEWFVAHYLFLNDSPTSASHS